MLRRNFLQYCAAALSLVQPFCKPVKPAPLYPGGNATAERLHWDQLFTAIYGEPYYRIRWRYDVATEQRKCLEVTVMQTFCRYITDGYTAWLGVDPYNNEPFVGVNMVDNSAVIVFAHEHDGVVFNQQTVARHGRSAADVLSMIPARVDRFIDHPFYRQSFPVLTPITLKRIDDRHRPLSHPT